MWADCDQLAYEDVVSTLPPIHYRQQHRGQQEAQPSLTYGGYKAHKDMPLLKPNASPVNQI